MNKKKREFIDALDWLNKNDERIISMFADSDNPTEASKDFVRAIKDAGGNVEVEGNQKHYDFSEDDYASTIYITVMPPISKELFELVADINPDEFEEVAPNKYRYWWD